MPLKNEDALLVGQLGFDARAIELLEDNAQGKLLPFNPTHERVAGLAVTVADGTAAEILIQKIQPALIVLGYRAFWSDFREESGLKLGSVVAVLQSTDHFAILDAAKPWPEGHRGPEVIREKLKSYEQLCELEIVGAASDWVAVTFKSLPADLCRFAEDVYLFCPDSCDLNSGIGSKRKYTKEVRAAAKTLCPAVSEAFRSNHRAKHDSQMPSGLPEDFYDTLLDDAQKSVQLLAFELREEKYFFFWWD